jgi:hypothetical protein
MAWKALRRGYDSVANGEAGTDEKKSENHMINQDQSLLCSILYSFGNVTDKGGITNLAP